jgi:hypothetical protein
MITKHETVCITRSGFNFLHGEGIDLAAKVTYHRYLKNEETGATFSTEDDTICEMFIPRRGWWG